MSGISDLDSLHLFPVKMHNRMCFIKVVIETCASPTPTPTHTRPKMPFGGDNSQIYLRNIYESELGSRVKHFYNNFYETH